MQKNYNENLVAGAAIRDDKGRRISKLFEASHPKMTVGYAKNLIMPNTPTEQEFNFRQSGGGVIEDGVAVIDKVKGNSVVWNQMVNHVAPQVSGDTANLTCTKEADGRYKIVLSAQVTELSYIVFAPIVSTGVRAGHKYMSKYGESDNLAPHIGYSNGNGVWWQWTPSGEAAFDSIVTPRETTDLYGTLYVGSTLPAGTYYILPTLFDLTKMFGAGNEPTTYEEFLQRKPKVADEYAYNEGTIVDNEVEKVKSTGVNLWDEEWENGYIDVNNGGVDKPLLTTFRSKNYTPIPSGETLYVNRGGYGATLTIAEYDAKKAYVRFESIYVNGVIEMPSNVVFIRFYLEPNANTSVYNHDICINLSDPTINGQYFPYEKHELDLSWIKDIKDTEGVKLFEDGMKSAGTAFDEVTKGRAIKRFGVKVFDGTEEWRYYKYYGDFHDFVTNIEDIIDEGASLLCNLYPSNIWVDKSIHSIPYYENNCINVVDSAYDDVASWKSHLADLYAQGNPLTVIYELTEPIEVEYDEKNLTYPVVAGGTEEAIASEPSSAFRADIGYGIDAVKTILDLKARVEALEGK